MSRAKRRTKEEREAILRELEYGGRSMDFICRKHGVSPGTIRAWRSRDGIPPKLKGGRPSKADEPVATVATPSADRCNTVATGGEDVPKLVVLSEVTAPPPETKGQLVATLFVNKGLSRAAIARQVGVSAWTVGNWLTKPGPVRDYVEELRAVQRQATAEHVAEVAYYGAKAAAGAARIAAQMTDDALDATGDEALSQEELDRIEAVNRLQANAIGGVKALSSTFAKAWEAADVGAINTTRTEVEEETPAAKARELADRLAGLG